METTVIHDLEHIWPMVQALALCFLAVMGFAVRSQLARLSGVERVLRDLQHTLENLNVTLVELKASYLGHVDLDESRFAAIEHRLDAHRMSIESLRKGSITE